MALPSASAPLEPELARCLGELASGLAQIDFPEVTDADRVMFLEHAVAWQVRRALRAGRFDLALAVSAQGRRVIADHVESHRGWRPVLVHGRAVAGAPGDAASPGPGAGDA